MGFGVYGLKNHSVNDLMVNRCLLLVHRYLITIQITDFLSAIQVTIQLTDHSAIGQIIIVWIQDMSGNQMPLYFYFDKLAFQ